MGGVVGRVPGAARCFPVLPSATWHGGSCFRLNDCAQGNRQGAPGLPTARISIPVSAESTAKHISEGMA